MNSERVLELKEVLEHLDIEEVTELEYFENMSDLIEWEKIPSEDVLFLLFSKGNRPIIAELLEEYFEDMKSSMPEDVTDMLDLMESIKISLVGLVKSSEDEKALIYLAEEFYRFKLWYLEESKVICTSELDGWEKTYSLRDGLAAARLDKIEGERCLFDFEGCLTYEIDDYILEFAESAMTEEDEENNDLFENGYIYDDEMKGY